MVLSADQFKTRTVSPKLKKFIKMAVILYLRNWFNVPKCSNKQKGLQDKNKCSTQKHRHK